ncbi:adenylosuccinate synthase [Simkania sp.]|uniref:adenylosuccinate synthase n=1 Tax=Simkania sp. TaxID=34094 RepID=UPI003B52ECB7
MPTLAVIGLQWGDEGKGKIVDLLSSEVEIVVRAQGGNNAGHSVIAEGKEYHFHLISSGILSPTVTCMIAGGVVIDPASLLEEMKELETQNISFEGRLWLSPYAHVVLPYHRLLDAQNEREKGSTSIGTTGKGIGPCYSDAVARLGIRICDFISPEIFKNKLRKVLPIKNRLLEKPIEVDAIIEEYSVYAEKLKPFVKPLEVELAIEIKRGKKILFEGAQGALLDISYGTYPFVTSSHTTSGGLALGAGVGPQAIQETLGIVKAYATQVGNGPFPTEFNEGETSLDPKKAREFGTTTGRQRRMGWFDAVLVSHAIRLSEVTSLALTKLDILDQLPTIKICTGYELDGEKWIFPPPCVEDLERVTPIYEEVEGWQTDTSEIKQLEEFPKNVRLFLNKLESLLGIPIDVVSFGPEREKTWKRKPFF